MDSLTVLIDLNAHKIMAPAGVCYGPLDKGALLMALADNETSFGKNNLPRFEAAYAGPNPGAGIPKGGFYYRKTSAPHVKKMWWKWGDHASHSYGPWQILYVTAYELGYRGPPADLQKTEVVLPWVIRLLNRRVFRHGNPSKGAKTVAQVFDAWNSGTHRDENIPHNYIAKGVKAYRRRRG